MYQKLADQMEGTQIEFEMAVEKKPALKEFADEVTEKVESMCKFKKICIKFTIGMESYLKKDTPPQLHPDVHVHM
jgi:hypothetical protein